MMANPAVKKTPSTNGAANLRRRDEAHEKLIDSLNAQAEANQEQERPRSILELAHLAVNGDRADNYGDQLTNFTNIADRMTITLREKLIAPITPQEVALLMLDVKLARLAKTGGRHKDSIVDVAGYAECLDKVNQPS